MLNEAREFSEQIIDTLYPKTDWKKKPRTYREKARKAYLAVAKQRRPSGKVRRRGIKQQLQYVRRNLAHIERLLEHWPEGSPLPLPRWLLYRYWVIQHVYEQQWEMYRNKRRRCDDRIVSISQPYVRPIIRGKLDKPVEFGAKLSVSLSGDGVACVDHLRWDAFHEGGDLKSQVEAYRLRQGHYPAVVLGDPVYGKAYVRCSPGRKHTDDGGRESSVAADPPLPSTASTPCGLTCTFDRSWHSRKDTHDCPRCPGDPTPPRHSHSAEPT